jgi:hypothetical protein
MSDSAKDKLSNLSPLSDVEGSEPRMNEAAVYLAALRVVESTNLLPEYAAVIEREFWKLLSMDKVASVWPNIVAPAQYVNPAPGWEDPRLPDFRRIWELAREVGYAVGVHGSLKRDVDLIAAPWSEQAVDAATLVSHLCAGMNAAVIGVSENKPHGRIAFNLQFSDYTKHLDLSVMPLHGSASVSTQGLATGPMSPAQESNPHSSPVSSERSDRQDQDENKDHGAALLPADPSASPATTEALPTADCDYVEYLQLLMGDDYLAYAARHLRAALLKRDDAPCSSMQHERQATLALRLGRVPTSDENLDWSSEAPRDPEEWPCSYSYHDHATRHEAVECALERIGSGTVVDAKRAESTSRSAAPEPPLPSPPDQES